MRFLSMMIAVAAVSSMPGIAHASGDAVKGKAAYARCAICHGVKAGEKKIGPTMAGVVGRKSGTLAGFVYSPAMKKAAMVWNEKNLDTYLTKPMATIPGNKMAFAGVSNPADRANIIAYLKTLK